MLLLSCPLHAYHYLLRLLFVSEHLIEHCLRNCPATPSLVSAPYRGDLRLNTPLPRDIPTFQPHNNFSSTRHFLPVMRAAPSRLFFLAWVASY